MNTQEEDLIPSDSRAVLSLADALQHLRNIDPHRRNAAYLKQFCTSEGQAFRIHDELVRRGVLIAQKEGGHDIAPDAVERLRVAETAVKEADAPNVVPDHGGQDLGDSAASPGVQNDLSQAAPETEPESAAGPAHLGSPGEIPGGDCPSGSTGIRTCLIEYIKQDQKIQPRTSLDEETIEEYSAAMLSGTEFPPVTCFEIVQEIWLVDGWHRLEAAKRAGRSEILVEVCRGTMRDARLCAIQANAVHGLPLTRDDRKRLARELLEDPEWCQWSDKEIARRVGLSDKTVALLRPQRGNSALREVQYRNKHGSISKRTIGSKRADESGRAVSVAPSVKDGDSTGNSSKGPSVCPTTVPADVESTSKDHSSASQTTAETVLGSAVQNLLGAVDALVSLKAVDAKTKQVVGAQVRSAIALLDQWLGQPEPAANNSQ